MQINSITKGNILVAQPTLYDVSFNRSVLIITDHNEHGSIGFILNKPIKHSVNLYVSELESDFEVYEGGPVEIEHMYFLHKRPDLIRNSEHVSGEIYWAGDYEDVKNAINNGLIRENEIRFYLGYSGWAESQLQEELDDNAWILIDEPIDIFENWDNNLWRLQLTKLGGDNLLWVNAPADPSLN